MVSPNDIDLYSEEHVAGSSQSLPGNDVTSSLPGAMVNGGLQNSSTKAPNKEYSDPSIDATADADVSMVDATGTKDGTRSNGRQETNGNEPENEEPKSSAQKQSRDSGNTDADYGAATAQQRPKPATTLGEGSKAGPPTTAASSKSTEELFVHPMFLAPPGSRPDRNMGIPEAEAEDLRRLLALYVQKQEEICRAASRLHHGLLRARRLRSNVLNWAKAEAHCGPNRDMSDGEDWYDKEEWGLTEDLKKGQDEEEEDNTITTGKKTRARRN